MENTNQQQQIKSWWVPVWRGLAVDSEARHYRQMKNAVWLFIYLMLHADRSSGNLYRKQRTIAQDMGVGIHLVREWLKRLHEHGYITIKQTGHAQVIHIRKWKTLLTAQKAKKFPHPG